MDTLLQNKWLILCSVESILIIYLFIKLKKKSGAGNLEKEILKSKGSTINMTDVMNDINLAPALYKKLSRVCHPDRFAGQELESTANILFQELQQAENNYAALCKLKSQIEKQLNISIS
jgi:hypothetical protein